MVRYWDKEAEQPVTHILNMPVCNIATAEVLFTAIEKEFRSCKIPWSILKHCTKVAQFRMLL